MNSDYRLVTARSGLNVRDAPSKGGLLIKILPYGAVVLVLDTASNGYVQIAHEGGLAYAAEQWLTGFYLRAWPTIDETITQGYGENPERYRPFGFDGHEGIDIAAPLWSPIYAIADGEVVRSTNLRRDGTPSAYGWHVEIEHPEGYTSLYAHLASDEHLAVEGWVRAGERIGTSGNTGRSTGPHLHFSLKKDGAYIDPTLFINMWLGQE